METNTKVESITYVVTTEIVCASASHEEPHVCTNREVEIKAKVNKETGTITIEKVHKNNGYGRGDNGKNSFTFINSDPQITRAIGKLLVAAADIADQRLPVGVAATTE